MPAVVPPRRERKRQGHGPIERAEHAWNHVHARLSDNILRRPLCAAKSDRGIT